MKETILLKYYQIDSIFNNKECSSLEQANIHDYQFIVGPHFIDFHWYAVIIDMRNHQFYFIAPKGTTDDQLQYYFYRWIQYYNKRSDKSIEVWHKIKINHPIQMDSYNCAIFVINFIYFYVNTRQIDLNASNMTDWRNSIADAIKSYCT